MSSPGSRAGGRRSGRSPASSQVNSASEAGSSPAANNNRRPVPAAAAANGRNGAAAAPSNRSAPAAAAAPAEADDNDNNDPDRGEYDLSGDDSEGSGEELLDERLMEEDYKEIAELDHYDSADLDDTEYGRIGGNDRVAAEREMRKRDSERARRSGRDPAALDIDDYSEETEDGQPRRRRRIEASSDADDAAESIAEAEAIAAAAADGETYTNLSNIAGPVKELLQKEPVRREVRRRFRLFLSEYTEPSTEDNNTIQRAVYPPKIVAMCRENRISLEVSFMHLSSVGDELSTWIADEPSLLLEVLNEEAFNVACTLFPLYDKVASEVFVRITDLPIQDSLRDLRKEHLNCLIKVEGVVTRRTGVFPQLKLVKFNCGKCSELIGPYTQQDSTEIKPGRCPQCQSTGPFIINSSETVYRNYQKITLQESPGSVPAGRVPRQKDIILLADLIDSVSPGELVEITGIYKHSYDSSLNSQQGFPVFTTMIIANYVCKQSEQLSSMRLTDADKEIILKLSKRSNIAELVFNSIGPSIYGHKNIKIALAMAMFSGEPKEFENGHRIRGDINVLVLGDPGTAKSQFLKYAEKTAHRAVYTTGKGASAVGLTASVHRDVVTREWSLEGGALVLADRGVCLIDEFDKMNDQDRTSIHEAMEQQSISISKAGIITTLKARCSVIAAANPVQGRYNSAQTFQENVELSDAILSRFDCLCVVRDTVDIETDARLAAFVVGSHIRAHPNSIHTENPNNNNPNNINNNPDSPAAVFDPNTCTTIPQDILKKYIMYARENIHPKLTNMDDDKIARLYADLRRESMITGGLPIAVRHIESMIRMSEANAKIHLRDYVIDDDVNMSIRIMLESFISTQKFSVMRSLRKHFDQYLNYKQDEFELLLFILLGLVSEHQQVELLNADTEQQKRNILDEPVSIGLEEFINKSKELSITNLDPFLQSELFKRNSFKLEKNRKNIIYRRSNSVL